MNAHLTEALAHRHHHELRQQAARHRAASHGARAPLPGGRPGLRSRVGFTLLSAGLHLVASAPHTAE